MNNHFKNKNKLRMLSLGSGSCNNEIELSKYSNFEEIICIDISENRLKEAKHIADKKNINNIKFVCDNFYSYDFPLDYFDIVLFNMSLHHIKNVENYLSKKIKPTLKNKGHLIINEYVGPDRLQFQKKQINKIKEALKMIPKKYRKRYLSSNFKNIFYGSGLLRVYLSDPSECIDSSRILPSIYNHFSIVSEKPYGGNILMNVLKDISHNFVQLDTHKEKILNDLFEFEDNYLKNNKSHFIFGIYQKTN